MTEEIIIDKEDKTKKHRNNEIDCLHFSCRKGESGKVLLWCDFYDDHCDNYTGCYYRKYLRLEQENFALTQESQQKSQTICVLEQENKELKEMYRLSCLKCEYKNTKADVDKYRSALEEIKEDMEQDTTCESRECGCDDYAECLNCIKETILNKINEVLGDNYEN